MTAQIHLDLRMDPPPDLAHLGVATEGTGRSWAAFDPGGSAGSQYRYLLGRHWHDHGVPGTAPRIAVFVMLNPSTADAFVEDPTIRRCIAFAERELMSGLIVANLFGWRSKNPRDLLVPTDPVGAKNIPAIRWALEHPHRELAIAAWGRFPSAKVAKLALEPMRQVRETITREGFVPLHCLGRTLAEPRQPRHPLMLASDTRLERWP